MRFQFRTLLIFDFYCGLSGGLLYFIFFDFLIGTLGLPHWVVTTQLFANTVYGIFGASLFFSRTQSRSLFWTLVIMNFVYAIFCMGLSLFLFQPENYWGATLVLVEGAFVFTLAKGERDSLKTLEGPMPTSTKPQ